MKHRLSRVNEVLQRELGDLLQREFTFTAKLVTVQQVDVTPDLKQAHVYISIIGTEEERFAAMAQLHDRRAALQSELSKRVVLKFTPHLHFVLDAAVERGTRVLGILNELGLAEPEKAADDSEEMLEDGEPAPASGELNEAVGEDDEDEDDEDAAPLPPKRAPQPRGRKGRVP